MIAVWLGWAWAGQLGIDVSTLPRAGTVGWDRAVRFQLLAAFDENRSRWLERREVRGVPCEVWRQLDGSIAGEALGAGLLGTYGFEEGQPWGGEALGFRSSSREVAAARMRECGLTGAGPLDPGVPHLPDSVGAMLSTLPAGTSHWEEFVHVVLVYTYDLDGDARIAIDSEIEAIDCGLWKLLDRRLADDTGSGLVSTYGLAPDRPWRGARIGIEETVRTSVFASARRCGLRDAREP